MLGIWLLVEQPAADLPVQFPGAHRLRPIPVVDHLGDQVLPAVQVGLHLHRVVDPVVAPAIKLLVGDARIVPVMYAADRLRQPVRHDRAGADDRWASFASIISQSTRPILATVMAPETVTTMVQSGSAAMAERTSKASPNSRPPKAVRDIRRSMSAKPVTRPKVERFQRLQAVFAAVVQVSASWPHFRVLPGPVKVPAA